MAYNWLIIFLLSSIMGDSIMATHSIILTCSGLGRLTWRWPKERLLLVAQKARLGSSIIADPSPLPASFPTWSCFLPLPAPEYLLLLPHLLPNLPRPGTILERPVQVLLVAPTNQRTSLDCPFNQWVSLLCELVINCCDLELTQTQKIINIQDFLRWYFKKFLSCERKIYNI